MTVTIPLIAADGAQSTVTLPAPTVGAGAAKFTVANGQIIGLNGKPWIGGGVVLPDSQWTGGGHELNTAYQALSSASGGYATTLFPGINMLRVGCGGLGDNYPWNNRQNITGGFLDNFVTWAASLGIVVVLCWWGDSGGQNTAIPTATTGGISANGGNPSGGTGWGAEMAGWTALATRYINNPYVWFETCNEPSSNNPPNNGYGSTANSLPALAAWQRKTYDTIRATGNTNPVIIEVPWAGGVAECFPGIPSNAKGYTPQSVYPANTWNTATNIMWDLHQYAWWCLYLPIRVQGQNPVSQAAITAAQPVWVSWLQNGWASADGVIPVIVNECGNSTNASTIDVNGMNMVNATAANTGVGKCFQATTYYSWYCSPGDELFVNNDCTQGLTSPYGTAVAAFTKTLPSLQPQ